MEIPEAILAFYEHGHVYANAKGFVSLHAYVSTESMAHLVATYF